jgi:hypothetical protein
MSTQNKLIEAASKITAKRAKTVIDHIIAHGHITTEELKDLYGYNHPPRAARDVREQGIPLETFTVTDKDGRKIGAYKFGDPDQIEAHKLGGRKVFSKPFKKLLVSMYGEKCAISGEQYEERYLQIDHRLPYEVAGDQVGSDRQPELFMLLSGAAQRQKSWSCENCVNFSSLKQVEICQKCYWAYPEKYYHVAMKEERRVDITFSGKEIPSFDELKNRSEKANLGIQEYIKKIVLKEI